MIRRSSSATDAARLIEALDVYRIGADLLELAATDVEDSRAFVEQSRRKRRRSGASAAATETA